MLTSPAGCPDAATPRRPSSQPAVLRSADRRLCRRVSSTRRRGPKYHQSISDQLNSLAAQYGQDRRLDAAAGQIGEYLTATTSAALATQHGGGKHRLDNSTPGDWDVSGNGVFQAGSLACTPSSPPGSMPSTARSPPRCQRRRSTSGAQLRHARGGASPLATTVWVVAQAGVRRHGARRRARFSARRVRWRCARYGNAAQDDLGGVTVEGRGHARPQAPAADVVVVRISVKILVTIRRR